MFWPSAQTPYPNNAKFKPKLKVKKETNSIHFSMRNQREKKPNSGEKRYTIEMYYPYIVFRQIRFVVPRRIAAMVVVEHHQSLVVSEDSFACSLDFR